MLYEAVSVHDPRLHASGVEREGVLFEATQLRIPAICAA